MPTLQRAQAGDAEAKEMLAEEEKVRKEKHLPGLRDELAEWVKAQEAKAAKARMAAEDEEIMKILADDSRVIWRRPK